MYFATLLILGKISLYSHVLTLFHRPQWSRVNSQNQKGLAVSEPIKG